MREGRLTRWCEYLACAVLVCVSSEIAFERWVIAEVVGPIVADVPRPEPLPDNLLKRLRARYTEAVTSGSFEPSLVAMILGDLTRVDRSWSAPFDGQIAKELVIRHSEPDKHRLMTTREIVMTLWLRNALTRDERLMLHAQEGWFGAGNLKESARLLLRREAEDVSAGELAYLLARSETGGGGDGAIARLVARREAILHAWVHRGVISWPELDAETPHGGIPESLAEKVLSCPKEPECASTDDT